MQKHNETINPDLAPCSNKLQHKTQFIACPQHLDIFRTSVQ